jgi:hypothetical protein
MSGDFCCITCDNTRETNCKTTASDGDSPNSTTELTLGERSTECIVLGEVIKAVTPGALTSSQEETFALAAVTAVSREYTNDETELSVLWGRGGIAGLISVDAAGGRVGMGFTGVGIK